ncbi:hypothetical protein E4U56_000203 [Claviceps arundinis]|uniref:Uncharacterized protein n=1 Tax=Claviceps arundinis TaxID=1623583 RepID=A0A9P7MUS9_9HYPO|nr:hypothetical protein E4U56_000203 [Claviceps arundinis]
MAASVGFSVIATRGSPHTQALDQRLRRVPSPTPNISDTQADLSPFSTDEFLQCGCPKILPRSEDAALVACLDNDNLPETAQAAGCQVLSGGDEEEVEEEGEEADDAKNGLSIYQNHDDETHVELWSFDRAPGSSNDMNGYKLRNIAAGALQVACSEVPPEDAVALAKQHLSLRDDRTTISTPPSLKDALGMSRSHSVDLPDNHSMNLPENYYTYIPDDYCMDVPDDFCTNMRNSYPTNMPNYSSVNIEDTYSVAIPNNYSIDLPDTCSVGIREKAKLPPMRDGSDKLESSGQYLPSIHEVVCASGYNNTRFEAPTAASLATISQPGSEALVTRAPGRPLRPKPPRSKSPVSTSACSHEANPRGLPSLVYPSASSASRRPLMPDFRSSLSSETPGTESSAPSEGTVILTVGPRREFDAANPHVNAHHAGKSKDDPMLQQAFAYHEG